MSIGIIKTSISPCVSIGATIKSSRERCYRKIWIRIRYGFFYSKIWFWLGYWINCERASGAPRSYWCKFWLIYINSFTSYYFVYKNYCACSIYWQCYFCHSCQYSHRNWGGCHYWWHWVAWCRCHFRWIYNWLLCAKWVRTCCLTRIKNIILWPCIINCSRSKDSWV